MAAVVELELSTWIVCFTNGGNFSLSIECKKKLEQVLHKLKLQAACNALAIQGRNTQNSLVFCNFNKITILK